MRAFYTLGPITLENRIVMAPGYTDPPRLDEAQALLAD